MRDAYHSCKDIRRRNRDDECRLKRVLERHGEMYDPKSAPEEEPQKKDLFSDDEQEDDEDSLSPPPEDSDDEYEESA